MNHLRDDAASPPPDAECQAGLDSAGDGSHNPSVSGKTLDHEQHEETEEEEEPSE